MAYWAERDFEIRQNLLSASIYKLNKRLKKDYKNIAYELIKEIKAVYSEIMSSPNPTADELFRYRRYYDLLNELETKCSSLSKSTQMLLQKEMVDLYKITNTVLKDDFPMVTEINDHQIDIAINQVWCSDGKVWSDRIWTNKDKLKDALSRTLIDAVSTGHVSTDKLMEEQGFNKKTYYDLDEALKKKFDSAYKASKRLVVTELAHVQNEAAIDRMKGAGVQKVQILTFDDSPSGKPEARAKHPEKGGVCDECKEYEGKVYFIDDMPIIPSHP